MTNNRYDDRRSSYGSAREHSQYGYDRDDRGFFERARDEVASWFGDERAEVRRDLDERYEQRLSNERAPRNYGSPPRQYDRYAMTDFADERRPYSGRPNYEPGPRSDFGAARASIGERWDRDLPRRDPESSAQGMHDRDYSTWRNRQIDDLDRDYDEFRRENAERFESEFTNWRNTRQTKRGILQQVTEQMEVVGSDGKPVGKVDTVRGDRIVLTKKDSPDGQHHLLTCGLIDKVEKDRLVLEKPAEEAIAKLVDNSREQPAMFERDDRRGAGPHMLNRSFSGTY